MRRFTMTRAGDVDDALLATHGAPSQYCAGGTTLIDLMRQDVERPERVVAINRLPLTTIQSTADNGLRHWRARDQQRRCAPSQGALGLPPTLRSDSLRRDHADSQHGDDRR